MLGFLKKLFSGAEPVDFAELVKNGAKMIDVRSKAEFASGHAKGSVNIPLDQIASKASTLNKKDVIIVCCRSGNRSASAVRILNGKGFGQVYNAGPWTTLRNLK
ncbi:MAG: rhodanese-like domain-containing protein [Flavobacteriales bacterium]